jgi:hypothetical protein
MQKGKSQLLQSKKRLSKMDNGTISIAKFYAYITYCEQKYIKVPNVCIIHSLIDYPIAGLEFLTILR